MTPKHDNTILAGDKHYFKAALINIFILTVSEITMCNVKRIPHSDKPTPTPLISTEHFSIFQLIVLVLLPERFTLTALINLVSSSSRQPFYSLYTA